LSKEEWLFQWNGENPPRTIGKEKFSQKGVKNLLFAENLSEELKNKVFDIVEPQKAEFSGIAFPGSDFIPFSEFENAIKIDLSEKIVITEPEENPEPQEEIAPKPEPQEEIAPKPEPQEEIAPKPEEETIKLPIIGKIKTEKFSLPILTFLIGLADGFNPCAFFVLTFLLAALIGLAGARKKILLVGSIFIFFSALFYFLFMSVLLNVFQLGGKITILTLIAGAIAVFAGIGATAIIAATVNIYELLCTFGFPMVYTRILTLRELPPFKYYLYLIFYNLVYVIPLEIVVLIFAITLGRKTFSQLWVRRLKLISGFMILFLGLVLMLKPKLLESVSTAFSVLIGAMIISGIIIFFHSLYSKERA